MRLINLIIGILIEWFALTQLMAYAGGWDMYRYFFLHAIASLFITFFEIRFLPNVYQRWGRQALVVLYIMNFSILSFGFLLTLVFVLFGFRYMSRSRDELLIEKISFNQISDSFPEIKRIFGEGSLTTTLSNDQTLSSKKIKALTTLNNTKNPEAMRQIKQSLGDASDEVRLYSFSLIDNFEKELNHKIHNGLIQLQHSSDESTKGCAYKELAFLYWEMLYYEITDLHLKEYFIDKVHQMINSASTHLKSDAALLVLLGRLYLFSGQIDEAEKSFKDALLIGAKVKGISSYMAEIAYVRRDFSEVRYWLGLYPDASIDLKMYSIYHLWTAKQ